MTPDTAYLDFDAFKLRSILPSEDMDQLEASYPGFVAVRLLANSAWINARLKKRYAVPFDGADPPQVVLGWLDGITTYDCYLKRGFNPTSAQDAYIRDANDTARAEVKEAADSKDGLFDLPLKTSDAAPSGVTNGGPLSYSEQSPYTWARLQAHAGRNEDNR